MRVADYIVKRIVEEKVKDVFLVSGGGMMFLSDAIVSNSDINFICNHHEQASAMAAVAYAKYTNNLGVAYVTTGCGGTNAITGVLNAWQDSAPCLFISGQVKRAVTTNLSGLKLRQFGVQELDIIPVVESITKYAVMVNDPQKIAFHLDKAIWLAKHGRSGPVWIDVPMDVQSAEIREDELLRFVPDDYSADKKTVPTQIEFEDLKNSLSRSVRPIIVAGQGVRLAGVQSDLLKFIEEHQIPVVAPYLGVGVLPTGHPLYIGVIGVKANRAANFAVQNADLVLVLGSRLSVSSVGYDYKNFAREAKRIVVDIDEIEHQKPTIKIDLFIKTDLKSFFLNLPVFNATINNKWVTTCQKWKEQWPVFLPEYKSEPNGVNLYYFVNELSNKMKDDAVLISDAGSSFYVTTQAINIKNKQRYITSGGQAEMGWTLPACIGASVAIGNGEVLGITGDGSLQMNLQELQTIVHNNLPIKLFVWNNDGYLSIRNTQNKFFNGRAVGTDSQSGVSFPNIEKISQAYGLKYFKISNSQDVELVIDQVLAYDGPVVCEVICLRNQEIVPTVSSYKKEDGTMVSKPMEDMYPFLSRDEFLANMIIKPIEE